LFIITVMDLDHTVSPTQASTWSGFLTPLFHATAFEKVVAKPPLSLVPLSHYPRLFQEVKTPMTIIFAQEH